ncbi:MAG: MCP four helix bundle domain-containing protein [Opitutae bacterium]|nr:MCP four helix bundle domain-containing protein [Opitutae bacterium]
MIFNRLKFILIVALLASNLLVGVFSLYFLNSINERYATLLDSSVPVINSLRTLTRELGAVQRLARRVVDPTNETSWKDLVQQLDDGSNSAKAHAREISAMEFFRDTRFGDNIARSSTDYDEKADAFLSLVRAQKFAEANVFNAETLRPSYDRYMLALDGAAAHVQREGAHLSASYAADSKLFSGFLLAFAGWPLLAAGIIVLVMAVLLVVLMAAVLVPGMSWRRPAES